MHSELIIPFFMLKVSIWFNLIKSSVRLPLQLSFVTTLSTLSDSFFFARRPFLLLASPSPPSSAVFLFPHLSIFFS